MVDHDVVARPGPAGLGGVDHQLTDPLLVDRGAP